MASFDEETGTKILSQVEFYFSDSNLPRDKFLRKSVTQSKDGFVSLALVCSFSRMRNLLGLGRAGRDDIPERILEGVAEILRQSNFLKVSDDGKRVGRRNELLKPEEVLEQIDRRTIAAAPFEYNIKMEDVGSFFSRYGKVNSVRLPHHIGDKRYFCGTALVEFTTVGEAEEVLKQNLVYSGAGLVLTPKKEFDSQRGKIIKEFANSRSFTGSSDNDTSNSGYCKGLLVAFTLTRIDGGGKVAKKEESKKRKNGKNGREDKVAAEKSKETDSKKEVEDAACQSLHEPSADDQGAIPLEKNCDAVSCEDLKDGFQRFGTVKHIDYCPRSSSGYICFEDAETTIKARAAVEFVGGLVVKKNFSVVLGAVNGEMEREFWKIFRADQVVHERHGDAKGWKEKDNKRERGFEGKRPRGKGYFFADQPPEKVRKVET